MTTGKTFMWYDDPRELRLTAEYLYEQGELPSPEAIFSFLEKPWHWENKRVEYKKAQDIPL